MSNLLEKALITGFGIFILIMFLSLAIPFFDQLNQYNSDQRKKVENFLGFINEVDSAITIVNNYPHNDVLIKVDYPEELNLTLTDKYAKFYYLIDNIIHSIIYEYDYHFIDTNYQNMIPSSYLLRVSIDISLINVTLAKFNSS